VWMGKRRRCDSLKNVNIATGAVAALALAMVPDSLDPGSLMGQLKMSELIERARTLGAPNDVIDECMDHTDVRSLTRSADPIPEVSQP